MFVLSFCRLDSVSFSQYLFMVLSKLSVFYCMENMILARIYNMRYNWHREIIVLHDLTWNSSKSNPSKFPLIRIDEQIRARIIKSQMRCCSNKLHVIYINILFWLLSTALQTSLKSVEKIPSHKVVVSITSIRLPIK